MLLHRLLHQRKIALAAVSLHLAVWASSAMGQEAPPKLQYAVDVAAGKSGVFLADRSLPGIWKVDEGKLSLFFQASKKFRTPLNAVRCLAFDADGKLLAGDTSSRNVYRFVEGRPQKLLTNRIGVGMPMSLAVDSSGRILIADLEQHQIVAVPSKGGEPVKVASVKAPRGLAVDGEDRIWVVSHSDNQVLRINKAGESETIVSGRPFEFPHHIAVDAQGVAYVADGYAKTIWKIVPGEKPAPLLQGDPLDNPVGLAMLGDKLLVADPRAKMLFEVDAQGQSRPMFKP